MSFATVTSVEHLHRDCPMNPARKRQRDWMDHRGVGPRHGSTPALRPGAKPFSPALEQLRRDGVRTAPNRSDQLGLTPEQRRRSREGHEAFADKFRWDLQDQRRNCSIGVRGHPGCADAPERAAEMVKNLVRGSKRNSIETSARRKLVRGRTAPRSRWPEPNKKPPRSSALTPEQKSKIRETGTTFKPRSTGKNRPKSRDLVEGGVPSAHHQGDDARGGRHTRAARYESE